MQTLLVIGANSDIAYALILALAKKFQPKLLLLASKNITLLQQTAQDIYIRTQITTKALELDLENLQACENFFAQLPIKPDALIYCAGYLGDQIKAQQQTTEALKIITINFTAAIPILNAAALDMAGKKQGLIVGISSVAGLRGRKKNYYYGAAKAAFTTYLSGLRNRLAFDDVQVLTVLPGFVNTKMVSHLKLPRLLTASSQEVAKGIVKAIIKKQEIVYIKKIWCIIMLVIGLIPEKIFKRLDL